MNYSTVTNPAYASSDKTQISCMVLFDGMETPLPFMAHAADPEVHGRQLFVELNALKFGQIAAYVPPPARPVEQYSAAIALGLAVVSGSTSTLNATYGVGPSDTADIVAEAQFIAAFQEFTNGEQSFGWPDVNGVRHTFPSTGAYMQFAKAAALYVSGCKQAYAALAGGATATFPSNIALIG